MNECHTDHLTELVDPFFGTDSTEFPEKDGLAASWFFPKAQAGNNHPGACLPFGMVSACAYSGAYVTGYGMNGLNCNGRPPRQFDRLTATGFSHFHQSGTGAIGVYYNYFCVTPGPDGDLPLDTRYTLAEETASPGYYAATLAESGIRAELTVLGSGAVHRYTFPPESRPHLSVNFAAGGLAPSGGSLGPVRPTAGGGSLTDDGFSGHVVMEGIHIYVCGRLRAGKGTPCLFADKEPVKGRELRYATAEEVSESFGVKYAIDPDRAGTCELQLAFSLKSIDQARANLESFQDQSFDEIRTAANADWEERLGRVRVEGDKATRGLFYSALYHSLLKPCTLQGESPFYDKDAPFYADFATLWDQYKTALPLIFSLFPDEGSAMVQSLLATADAVGEFSNAILLSTDTSRCAKQARGLTHHVLADARLRQLPGIDWSRALRQMLADLEKSSNGDFHATGIAHPVTHALDLSAAAFCTVVVADAEGEQAPYARLSTWSTNWKNVYDGATGILGESHYYEGGPWNYSFRLLHDMAGRIELHGGDDAFVKDLKRFFGYDAPPAPQQDDPNDSECMQQGFALNRFEGFNNEPDMETPYAFLYAGRHDLACEVIRAGMKHQFRPGRGGLPGNNDSGGLTAAYVWNALGLFPVPGQPLMLIGSPILRSTRLSLAAGQLNITAEGTSDQNIYICNATWNGQPLARAYLTMEEFLNGGELILSMGSEPGGWANDHRPPSYPTPALNGI